MKQLFIKLYDFLTAPLYRRLARDLTLQLQEISHAYVDQHERLTAKLLDELLRLHVRLDNHETETYARSAAMLQMQAPSGDLALGTNLSEEQIHELMMAYGNSLDTVELCAKHNIAVTTFFALEAKYRGCNADSIKKMRMLEATNSELARLLSSIVREKGIELPYPENRGASCGIGESRSQANDADNAQNRQRGIVLQTPVAKTENGNGRA